MEHRFYRRDAKNRREKKQNQSRQGACLESLKNFTRFAETFRVQIKSFPRTRETFGKSPFIRVNSCPFVVLDGTETAKRRRAPAQ